MSDASDGNQDLAEVTKEYAETERALADVASAYDGEAASREAFEQAIIENRNARVRYVTALQATDIDVPYGLLLDVTEDEEPVSIDPPEPSDETRAPSPTASDEEGR